VWWTKYKELTHLPAAPTLPLQEINIASLINKVNGKKVASTRGKKEKVSNAKIMNGFHVTVMILMDSGLNDAYPT
jgi:predicted thioesterase